MGSRPSVPRCERPKQKEEDETEEEDRENERDEDTENEAEEEDTDNNGSSPDESSDSDDDGATGLTDLLIMLRGALGDLAKEAVPSNKKLYGFTAGGRLTVSTMEGSITNERVHVIVNTISSDLDLSDGVVSAAILEAGGTSIQDELNEMETTLDPGHIVVTDAGELPAICILHGVLKEWDGPEGQSLTSMREMIRRCLEGSHGLTVESIAFPALGTGGLGIPPEFCAKVLHQEVLGFLSRHSTSTLSTIHFVLNPADQPVIQAFRTEHQRLVSGTNATPRTTSAAIEQPMQEATVAPASWTKTDQTSLMPHLVGLKPSDDSFLAIRNGLTRSGIKNTINSIIRIENMSLYQEYDVRKARVQKDCPEGVTVERILFHGTKADAVQDISINGFNRSYHGSANDALYGNGVYFAVNPAYSAQQQYSPPDGNKIKYIYQCRVLTGVFCEGERGLKAPPHIPSLPDGVRYDSVTDDEDNPTIFVIFRDSQVYPEYLIKLLDTDGGSTPDSNVVP